MRCGAVGWWPPHHTSRPTHPQIIDPNPNQQPPQPNQVTGILRGFDQFMNIVLDETVDEGVPDKPEVGLVVIRGNSVIQFECLERV